MWTSPGARGGTGTFSRVVFVPEKSTPCSVRISTPTIGISIALRARTLTDKDIFYNADAGLPRAERELAAAATSRFNGCIYCASVHSRFSATYSKREADVQRLLDEGVNADLGERWNAIVAAAVALSATPIAFGAQHVERLRRAGLDDLAIADVIQAAAFFNWANRLMLSLGEPAVAEGT